MFDDSGQGKGPFQFPKAFLPGAASTTAKFGYLLVRCYPLPTRSPTCPSSLRAGGGGGAARWAA